MNSLGDINPFADPSILDVTGQQRFNQSGVNAALDDYQPFENPQPSLVGRATIPASSSLGSSAPNNSHNYPAGFAAFGGSTGGLPSANGSSAGMASASKGYGSFTNLDAASNSPSMQHTSPPSYSSSSAQFVGAASTDELKRRQAELDQKAAELQRREEELQRQQLLTSQSGRRDNNWPPLPSWTPVQPCFYQDISVEIPVEFQKIVTYAYRLWMFHILVLALNFLGSMTYFIGNSSDGGGVFGLSILFLALFTPCSFVCWFRPLYKAFRTDSSINFMIFFFIFGIQSFASCIQTIGLDYFGTCGFINTIRMFGHGHILAGIVMLVVSLCFAAQALMDVFLLLRVHRLYRTNSTASVQKAREEFATEVMKNKEVQNIATRGAMEAAASAMSP